MGLPRLETAVKRSDTQRSVHHTQQRKTSMSERTYSE
jgi:hypothetical protein